MTPVVEHKLIIWGLLAVAVALIIYNLNGSPSITAAAETPATLTPGDYSTPALAIPGTSYTTNVPVTGLPQSLNIADQSYVAPQAPTYASNGDCDCGCGSGSDLVFNFPNETAVFNALQATADAALQANLNSVLNSFGYQEGVFVSNATPTPWAA